MRPPPPTWSPPEVSGAGPGRLCGDDLGWRVPPTLDASMPAGAALEKLDACGACAGMMATPACGHAVVVTSDTLRDALRRQPAARHMPVSAFSTLVPCVSEHTPVAELLAAMDARGSAFALLCAPEGGACRIVEREELHDVLGELQVVAERAAAAMAPPGVTPSATRS